MFVVHVIVDCFPFTNVNVKLLVDTIKDGSLIENWLLRINKKSPECWSNSCVKHILLTHFTHEGASFHMITVGSITITRSKEVPA